MDLGYGMTARDLECMLYDEVAEPTSLPLSLLKEITDGFSDKHRIGSSGFAVVYKGKLENMAVSVKRFFNAHMQEEFLREVECLMRVKHKNLIRFMGYCDDRQGRMEEYNGKLVISDVVHRLLCFEYFPKGSLDEYITDLPRRLLWRDCYQIIRGICLGLHYLHQQRIVHLHLTPANVFLDHNWVPKIADLSTSRSFVETQSHESYDLDIFSLGVLIIEILSGKKEYQDVDKIVESWSYMMDESQRGAQQEQLRVCAEIGLKCINFNPAKRLDTQHIISRLDETESVDGYIITNGVTSQQSGYMPLHYLKYITDNFSDDRILGKGGFGVVYKGVLHNGEMLAVKKISQAIPSSQTQFENEINLLMNLKHQNIVRLIGYCCETRHLPMPYEGKFCFAGNTESFLCLECLPNGSLEKYISDASSGLSWLTRCKVIEGISYGMQYLHEHSKEPIIHLDLKPANILLDANMLPKITDFGLSRLFDQNQTIYTAIRGTFGYMPPEFLKGIITPMSDIFSLGVLIMEVITGHRNYPDDIRKYSEAFIELELKKWRDRLQKEPGYTSLETDCQKIERCIRIGLLCVNPDRTKRPTMNKIINMLEGSESTHGLVN